MIKPLNGFVIVHTGDKKKQEEETKSGIILPKEVSDQKKQPVGIVYASAEVEIPIGAKVMFKTYGPEGIEVPGEPDGEFVVMQASEVIAIIGE